MSLNKIAFYLHRITGVVLALYLCMHFAFLTSLKTGDYERLVKASKEFFELHLLLFLACIYHGVNGIRLVIHEFGYMYKYRKILLYLTFVVTFVIWVLFCWKVIK